MRAPGALFIGSIIFFLTGIAAFVGAFAFAGDEIVARHSVSLLKKAIERADEIEISFLKGAEEYPQAPRYTDHSIEYAIVATRRLNPSETGEFLAVWKGHLFGDDGALCHDPGYIVRFKSKGKDVLTCTLCLECMNIKLEPFPFFPGCVALAEIGSSTLRLSKLESFLTELESSSKPSVP